MLFFPFFKSTLIKKGKNSKTNTLSTVLGNWYNIIVFLVLISSAIANYVISDYRHDQHDANYVKLEKRVSETEKINYDLLLEQIQSIRDTEVDLNNKLTKTNERIDNVLEILLSK